MKSYFYIDCASEELVRSSLEEQYFTGRSFREKARYRQNSPAQIICKIGPADPCLPFPFLLTLTLEGRVVVDADAEIGWQHQGLEKRLSQLSYFDAGKHLRLLNSTTPATLMMPYALAVERLFALNHTVSLRHRLLRVVMLEGERILHHWGVVERILELVLAAGLQDGQRTVHAHAKTLASLVSLQDHEAIGAEIEKLRLAAVPVMSMLRESAALRSRLQDLAIIDRTAALGNGLSGIYLRAAGVMDDIRHNHPELPYSMLDFQPPTHKEADAYARFILRLDEVEASLLLMSRALRLVGDASIASMDDASGFGIEINNLKANPCQVVTSFIEAPEGELAISVCSNGEGTPYRVRIKTPSFALMSALGLFLKGCDLDDVVLLLSTLGINTLEVDR